MTQTSDATIAEACGHWRDTAALIVTGQTPTDFLQGYLTSNTEMLTPGRAQPTALCNLKGRVLANGWALGLETGVALIVHRSLFDKTRQFLSPYARFGRCALGETARQVLVNTDNADIELLPHLRIELVETANPELADVSSILSTHLVTESLALLSAPVSEEFLPQMLGLDRCGAVDFNKGCYLGQEIVARAQFRGEVKRQLALFQWQDQPPAIGSTDAAKNTVISIGANGQGLWVSRVS